MRMSERDVLELNVDEAADTALRNGELNARVTKHEMIRSVSINYNVTKYLNRINTRGQTCHIPDTGLRWA